MVPCRSLGGTWIITLRKRKEEASGSNLDIKNGKSRMTKLKGLSKLIAFKI